MLKISRSLVILVTSLLLLTYVSTTTYATSNYTPEENSVTVIVGDTRRQQRDVPLSRVADTSDKFSVQIPTSLPIKVLSDGTVITAQNLSIINDSNRSVSVVAVRIDPIDGWSLDEFGTTYESAKVGSKRFNISLNGDSVHPGGTTVLTPSNWGSIPAKGSLPLSYSVNVSPQKFALANKLIATISITVAYDSVKPPIPIVSEFSKSSFNKVIPNTATNVMFCNGAPTESLGNPIADISTDKDGSVLVYNSGTNGSIYRIYHSTGGVIKAPSDCSRLFRNYSHLSNVTFDNIDTSRTRSLAGLFNGCISLLSIDLSQFNTTYVTSLNTMFAGCASLTNVNLSTFDVSLVSDFGAMFDGCRDLVDLDLSSFITTFASDMYAMFSNCTSLRTLLVPNFSTVGVKFFDSMFYNCVSLQTLNLESFEFTSGSNVMAIFYGCNSLSDLYVSTEANRQILLASSEFPINTCKVHILGEVAMTNLVPEELQPPLNSAPPEIGADPSIEVANPSIEVAGETVTEPKSEKPVTPIEEPTAPNSGSGTPEQML